MAAPRARAAAELRLLRAAVFTAVCVALSAGGHVLASDETVPLWTLGVAAALVFAMAASLAGRERSLPGIAALLALAQTALHGVFGLGQQHAAGGAPAGTPAVAAPATGVVGAASGAHGGTGGAGGHGEGGGSAVVELARRLLCNDHVMPLTEGQAREIVANAGIDPDGGIPEAVAAGNGTLGNGAAGSAPAGDAALGDAAGAAAQAPHPGHGGGVGAVLDLSAYSLPMVLGHLLAALAAGWLLRRGDAALVSLLRLAAATGVDLGPLRAAVRYVQALDAGLDHGGRPAVRRGAATAYDEQSARSVRELQHAVVRRGPPALALAA